MSSIEHRVPGISRRAGHSSEHELNILQRILLDRHLERLPDHMPHASPFRPLVRCKTSFASLAPRDLQGHKLAMPSKLFAILEDKRNDHIVSWLPGGRAWKIHDIEAFSQLLSVFFDYGSQNLALFFRLLKLWGFSVGAEPTTFHHPLFVQDVPQLLRMTHPTMGPWAASAAETLGHHNPSVGNAFIETRSQPIRFGRNESFSPFLSRGLVAYPRQSPKPFLCDLDAPPSVLHLAPKPSFDSKGLSMRMRSSSSRDCERTFRHLQAANCVFQSSSILLPSPLGSQHPSIGISVDVSSPSQKAPDRKSLVFLPPCSCQKPPKKARRKWLPPLGPAAANPSLANQRNVTESNQCDWLCTNPEVFASLAGIE